MWVLGDQTLAIGLGSCHLYLPDSPISPAFLILEFKSISFLILEFSFCVLWVGVMTNHPAECVRVRNKICRVDFHIWLWFFLSTYCNLQSHECAKMIICLSSPSLML